jgi:pimeloyl-ACP methyl ester carboxylesterase
MANFVLVHGAWHGGWCYRDTAAALRQMGHNVYTPTLTGLGERSHQSSERITLETHIRDVAGCLESEELEDVILCGHSYGGMVVTGLADRMADRINALVYIDAFVPEDGESFVSILRKTLEAPVAERIVAGFRGPAKDLEIGMMSPLPAAMFNVARESRDWVDRRCTPQSLATIEMPVQLSGKLDDIKRRLFILANNWEPNFYRSYATKFASAPGWEVVQMECGHDIMIDLPNELATTLTRFC